MKDFPTTLQTIFGESVKSLSPNKVVRFKEKSTAVYETWNKRDLAEKNYVYFGVDGVHVNVRLEVEADLHRCILVMIGVTSDGRKKFVAVGDGVLGFWATLRKVMPADKVQSCWFHKTAKFSTDCLKAMSRRPKERDPQDLGVAGQGEGREGDYIFPRDLPGEVSQSGGMIE